MEPFELDKTIQSSFGKQYLFTADGKINLDASIQLNKQYYRTNENEGIRLSPFQTGLLQQFPNNGYLIQSNLLKKINFLKNIK